MSITSHGNNYDEKNQFKKIDYTLFHNLIKISCFDLLLNKKRQSGSKQLILIRLQYFTSKREDFIDMETSMIIIHVHVLPYYQRAAKFYIYLCIRTW